MWLSWAFPELCEVSWKPSKQSLFSSPLLASITYSSEAHWRIQRTTARCPPPPPPYAIYFLYRMFTSPELNGSYVTQEENKRAKYQPTAAEQNAFFPISEPFSSQVFGLLWSFKIINSTQAYSHCYFCYHNFSGIEEKKSVKIACPLNFMQRREKKWAQLLGFTSVKKMLTMKLNN